VLEIGCGSGSSTVPIALNSGSVTAVDISSMSLDAAKFRADLLGVSNVQWALAEPSWLSKGSISWPVTLAEVNVVICYAVLEHLAIQERMHFLRSMWRDIAPGTKVVFFETPNRFAPSDWHSSDLSFAQVLPDELLVEYYSRSPRPQVRKDHALPATDNLEQVQRERLYRWGRVVSFHEFELAIGLDQFRIINDGYSSLIRAHRDQGFGAIIDFEEALISAFLANNPRVPASFARPSLDLIIEKP
jgi:ubiquinone/menaquinone biosynthesis C-methylase UbiE